MISTTEPRTVLLLGGTGFIGTNLGARLREAGYRVLVTGRGPASRDGHRAIMLPLDDADAIAALVRTERVETVIHLACSLIPSSTEADYLAELGSVSIPALRLARRLAAEDVRLIYLSSGGTVYGATRRAFAAEDDPCEPISLYGQSKLETELHLRFLQRTCGLRCLIVRPSNPFGLHQSLRGAQGLVSVILGRLANGSPLEVWGDGSAIRDYIYVEDAVNAIAGLIERDAQGIVNVGSGVGHSLLDVVDAVEAATGRRVPLEFRPARPADVPRLVLDVTRLAAMGLHQARPLVDGIRLYATRLGMING